MRTVDFFRKYNVFPLILAIAALAALFLPSSPGWRGGLAILYLIGMGLVIGRRFFPDESSGWGIYLGSLSYIAFLTVAGTVLYYLDRLDLPVTAFLLIAPPILAAALSAGRGTPSLSTIFGSRSKADEKAENIKTAIGVPLIGLLIFLIGYGLSMVYASATADSIRTPWDAVPRTYFVIVFMAALIAYTVVSSGLAGRLAFLAVIGFSVLAVWVAAAVYLVGFGFDPFIHQSTEASIFTSGVMLPKTLYYVGQYVLVTIVSRVLGGGVFIVDRYLVPIAFLAILPAAYWSVRRAFGWPRRVAAAAIMIILLLPLAPFIATTPQSLANVFALAAFFLAMPAAVGTDRTCPRWLIVLLTGAAAAVHPLAGIPLFFFCAAVFLLIGTGPKSGFIAKHVSLPLLIIIGAVALPAVFLINARFSSADVSLNTEVISAPSSILEGLKSTAVVARRFLAAYDVAYLWRTVRETFFIAVGIIGLFLLRRRHRAVSAYGSAAAIFLANFVLLRTVVLFSFLIPYERTYYADRLYDLTLYVLAVPAVYAFGTMLLAAERKPAVLRIVLAMLVAAFLTSSVYLAYPRRDLYETSHGWSTSASDVDAVRLIERDAQGQPYVALANQSVSAAAIREFGFKKYFTGKDKGEPIFYYPVPTGGPLYAEFENMNAVGGTAAAAQRAMDLAGVDAAYFVVNNYWWRAQKIILSARREANAYWDINHDDFVLKYVRK